MPTKRAPPFLKIVRAKSESTPLRAQDFAPTTWQSTLFARDNPFLLVFIDLEKATEADFLTVLVAANLRFMIDLRLVPRFDIGGMNRKLVFSLFAKSGTQYFDVSGRLDVTDRRDARLNPHMLADYLRSMVFRLSGGIEGPVGFIVDPKQFEDTYVRQLMEALPPASDRGWEILRVPYSTPQAKASVQIESTTPPARNLVFVSHANPQDNVFTLWLGTQLACAGYEVWSDVTRLFGGEEFWETIEEAIRRHAAKVIVVLSRKAQIKKGLLDEINCAVAVERSEALDAFVVPIRLDDLPFEDIRANLARKNIIDFNGNWAHGLSQLMKVLERDGVPRVKLHGAADTAAWCREHSRASARLSPTPELLVSNWLPIHSCPEHVLFHDISVPISQIDEVVRSLRYPVFRYLRLIGSFAEAHDFQKDLSATIKLKEQYRVNLDRFLAGCPPDLPGIQAREAHNFVSNLLRQAWANRAAASGLLQYATASGAVAWFAPKSLVQADRVTFIDSAGKRRRKNIVGWSERRQVYWHLAMELKPVLARVPRMVARAHIVFTTDGRTLVDSKERMHTMRRQFCKSWWNDRWRDLLLAYAAWLANGEDTFDLTVGSNAAVTLGGLPLMMRVPVSLTEEPLDEDIRDEVADELNLGESDDDDEDNDCISGSNDMTPPTGAS